MGNVAEYRALTKERFLFHEMRVVAKLLSDGVDVAEIKKVAAKENIFQYQTATQVSQIAAVCINRLCALESDDLVEAVANRAPDTAKMVCLYAVMRQNQTVCDFMVTTIGEKLRTKDLSFSRADVVVFMLRLQEQNPKVAGWSAQTIKKTESSLVSILLETEYWDGPKAGKLNSVWLPSFLKEAIIAHGDQHMLPAFNCFL